MFNLKEWAKQKTINNDFITHPFQKFLDECTPQELLQSQIPFFYAVQAFPRALGNLIGLLETNELRVKIVENLMEEHGGGVEALFHTNSFKQFLTSLGWGGTFHNNPWVLEWIKKLLKNQDDPLRLAATLSGIEYAYAPISQMIVEYLKEHCLLEKQNHYTHHAQIDWEHGWDLLEVASKLYKTADELENIGYYFEEAQNDFLELYKQLVVPTRKQMQRISQENISFYYTREDGSEEKNILQETINCNQNKEKNILLIASGGEHLFNHLSCSTPLNIDVVDMNPYQIKLCQEKLEKILSNKIISNKEDEYIGKFERIFHLLRQYLKSELINNDYDLENEIENKIHYAVKLIFSNEHLSTVFTPKATQYTKKDFSEHFSHLFRKQNNTQNKNWNFENVILGKDIHDTINLQQVKINCSKHKIRWLNNSFENMAWDKTYDIINISNIGDWMPIQDYRNTLYLLKNNLNHGGFLIARKLLGDYDLLQEMVEQKFVCHNFHDATEFYTQCVTGQNL